MNFDTYPNNTSVINVNYALLLIFTRVSYVVKAGVRDAKGVV